MKTYEELQKEWNESTYGNEFAHYVYSIDKETIERLEKEKEIDKVELMEMIHKVHEDMEGRYDLTGEDLYTIQALLCKLQ